MKTTKEILEGLKQSIDEAIETLPVEKQEEGRFVPEIGDYYECINSLGDVCKDRWENDTFDHYRLSNNNVFRVGVAQKVIDARKRIESKAFEPDWRNSNQRKFCVQYGCISQEFYCDVVYSSQIIGVKHYFKDEETAKSTYDDYAFLISVGAL
jgi:hypothetical protein